MALRLEIVVDDKGLPHIKRFVDDSKKKLDELGDSGKKSGSSIIQSFKAMKTEILAFTAATAGVVYFFKRTLSYADDIGDLSKATGIATETLSRLGFAASQSGGSMEAVAIALKTLAQAADDARRGSGEYVEAFKKLNVEFKTGSDRLRPIEQIFLDVADAMKNSKDKTEALAIASTLLGRGAISLGAMMSEGSAAIEKSGENAAVVTKEMADRAGEANDSLGEMAASVKNLALALTDILAPAMTKGIKGTTNFLQELRNAPDDLKRLINALSLIGTGDYTKAIAAFEAYLKQTKETQTGYIKTTTASREAVKAASEATQEYKGSIADLLPEMELLERRTDDEIAVFDEYLLRVKSINESIRESARIRKALAGRKTEEGPFGDIRGQIKPAKELVTVIGQINPILSDANIQFGEATDHFEELYNKSMAITNHIANNMTNAILNINAKTKVFKSIVSSIGQAILSEIVAALVQAIAKAVILRAVMGMLGIFGGVKGGVVESKQHGGIVGGGVPIRTMGGDNRLIAAQTGEGILTRRTVQRLGGAAGVRALNEGGAAGNTFNITVNANTADEMFFRRQFAPLMNDLIRHTPTDLMASRLGRR